MSYDFKRLSDVEVVAEPAESANVLIEENGVIKKASKDAVGVTSWNDLTDRPFGEEYAVLFDGIVAADNTPALLDAHFSFIAGEAYTVKIDETEYEVTAQSMEGMTYVGDYGFAMGQPSDNAPPFLIMPIPELSAVGCIFKTSGQKSLKITGIVAKTIEEKYLPTAIVNGTLMQFRHYIGGGYGIHDYYYFEDGRMIAAFCCPNLKVPKLNGMILFNGNSTSSIEFVSVESIFPGAFLCIVQYLNGNEADWRLFGKDEESIANAVALLGLSETNPRA